MFKDYKYHIKQKLVKNKKERTKTGGGPAKLFSFSPSEEAIIAVLDLEAATGLPDTLSFGDSNNNTIHVEEMEHDGEEISDRDQTEASTSLGIRTTSTPKRPTDNVARENAASTQAKSVNENLIKRQLEIQEEFHRSVSNLMNTIFSCNILFYFP